MKKILLCIFVFMAMLLLFTPSGFTSGGILSGGERIGIEQNTTSDFGVDYIGYTIHDPGWLVSNLPELTMKNSNNGKCGNCHMNLSVDNVPEPKQRSPDMMKGNTI